MKVTKLMRRATSLFLVLVMLFSFPVGAYSEGTGSDPEEAPEIPEGYVWRTLSVELEPFEEDRLEDEEQEAARLAEKVEEAGWFMELMLSHGVQAEEDEEASEPSIVVRGWMPEDVTARAELISYSEEDLHAELALMHTELRFYDGEGRSWTPAVPVSVFVDGDVVRELSTAKMDPTVYIYREEEPLPEEPEERLFSVEAFSAARTDGQEKTYEIEQEDVHVDVLEQPLMKDDEYPDAVCFETASESLRFAVTARQQERYYSASTEDGKTEIVAVGTLPKGLSAAVAPTSADLDTIKVPGRVLMGWDLSLTHPEEADYHIDGSVKLALHDAALADAQDEIWELQLWQLRENEAPVRVKNAVFRGEDLRFSAEELSTYVVVRVAVERCLTATDGESYSVRVSYDSNAGIPAGAELEVLEIRPDDAEYAKYMVQGIKCAKEQLPDLDFIKLFDITLRDPETGVTYQPNQNVKVSIELLSDSVAQSTEVKVVHFGQKTELMGSSVNGDAVSFETSGFSVYVVMGVTIEKTITAADGNTYEISVTYDRNAGIPADAELKVRELVGEDYEEYLSKTAEFLSRDEAQLVYSRIFDITIEKDGVVYEPNKAVSVSIKLVDRPETQGVLRVVHFADEGTELLENELTEDGTLEFRTDSFSVYAITDENGDVIVPRAKYVFHYSDGTPIPDTNNGRQFILSGGKLEYVAEDEMSGLYFLGWYVWDEEENSWGAEVKFDQPISVTIGDAAAVTTGSVTLPRSTDPQNPITFLEVKVKARYTNHYATVNFMNASYPEQVFKSIMVPVPEGQPSTTYVIPDASNEEYCARSGNNEFTFYGWSERGYNNTNYYYSSNDSRKKVETVTVTVGPDNAKKLYPMFKQGNWVFFNTSPVGAGASNIAPAFVTTIDKKVAQPKNPTWRGRLFKYWTTTPTFDKETGVVYQSKYPDQDNYIPDPEPYDFNSIVKEAIPDGQKSLELYAHWEPDISSYTVIVWKQSVQDDRDFSDSQKTYEFDSQYVIDWPTDRKVTLADASASLGINLTNLESDPATRANFVGFQHKVNQDPATGGYVDTVEATVLDNGSTVLNVYYDRNIIRIKFYRDYYAAYDNWHYTQYPNPEYEAGNGDDARWRRVNGKYERLEKVTEWKVDGVALVNATIAGVNTPGYDGKVYDRNGRATQYTFGNPPPADSTITYHCKYLTYGTSYSDYYIWKRATCEATWYTAEGELYEGTRYRLNSNWFWFTGLYGQNLSRYGYSWPKDIYQYFSSTNGMTAMSFLGQFVLPDGVRNPELNEMRLRYSGTSNCNVYFYLQRPGLQENGGYLGSADDVGYMDNTGNLNFTFSNKYDGYEVESYKRTYHEDGSNYDADWTTNNVHSGNGYGSVSLRSGVDLHIRYKLRGYSISYFDGMDGKPLATPIQDGLGSSVSFVDNVLFTADIAKYYPDPSFAPESQVNGWHFNGRWYSDKECRVQIFFGETDETKLWYYRDESGEKIYTDRVVTQAEIDAHPERSYGKEESECFKEMPNRNLALYAGFTKIWYWVKIDPHGGAFNNNDPSNINAKTYDKVEYDSVINEEWYNTISRNFVEDDAGDYFYHYDEFNMDDPTGDQPTTRMAYYVQDESLSTDGGKKYRPVQSEEEGYEFGGWYKVESTSGFADEKLIQYNFADKITKNTTIRALWKKKGSFYVYYLLEAVDENGEPVDDLIITGTAPVDEFKYASDSSIPVLPSTVKARNEDGVEYELAGWYFAESVVAPGGVHKADRFAAERHPAIDVTNPRRPYNTFVFRPCFKLADLPHNDAKETSLILDANGGERNTRYTSLPDGAQYNDDGTQVLYTQKLLNMSVTLPLQLPPSEGNEEDGESNVFVKGEQTFLGWAFNRTARRPALYPRQIVGIDNEEGIGYNTDDRRNILYAVWRTTEVTVSLQLRDYFTNEPVCGSKFTVGDEEGNAIPDTVRDLISSSIVGKEGYLASGEQIKFKLKSSTDPLENAVYVFNEIETARGYVPLCAPLVITVDYYGDFDVRYDLPESAMTEYDKNSLVVQGNNDEYFIGILQRPAICQIKNGSAKKLFGTLTEAVAYAKTMENQTATIEMLKHYVIPKEDVVKVEKVKKSDDEYLDLHLTLTTASGNDFLEENTNVAVLTREKSFEASLLSVVGGSLTLHDIILDGSGVTATGMTNGGLIYVGEGSSLTVDKDTTLRNSKCSADGGAIYLADNAEATVKDCTITGNKAVNGAGIYVSGAAKLNISGNINFGGSGIEGTALSTTAGNFSTTAISGARPTNAGMAYPYGRQDIYLAEDGDEPTTLFVTGALTGGDGTIWVWAASENHYGMNNDFAVATSPALLTDDTMHVFRNAREDNVTACGTKYLTGEEGSKTYWIAWTGGVNVNFKKTDGFGEKLAGAKFALFSDLECTNPIGLDGTPVTAVSGEDGVVTFEMVSSGIYYMQETVAPGNFDNNPNTYVLLVGKEYMTIPAEGGKISADWTRALAGSLSGIKQEEIDAQREAYNEVFNDAETYGETYKREQTFYVIFQLDIENHTHYVTTPDIARVGIVNVCTITRPVILSKINPLLQPLKDGKFTLRRIDGVEVKNDWSSEDWNSDESGVFFAGLLPLGTYLLEETQAPTNPRKPDETFSVPTHYYVFQVTENGIMGFKKNAEGEDVFALTNTITEATSEKYEINKESPNP